MGAGTVIRYSDWNTDNNKVSAPIIGRGFGVETNNLFGTCLEWETTTAGTFDYVFFLETMMVTSNGEFELSNQFRDTMHYAESVNTILSSDFRIVNDQNVRNVESRTLQRATAIMQVDRYQKSMDEMNMKIGLDASALLEQNDLIGFFQSCGSSFIRSSRRVSELVLVFTWEQVGFAESEEFAVQLERSLRQFDREQRINSSEINSLTIEVVAFGLSFGNDGGNLLPRSLEDVNRVMDHGFKSMMNDNSGLIMSIEVIPWVSNLQFQSKLSLDEFDNSMGLGSVRRYNIVANSEHIVRIETILRAKVASISSIQNCLIALRENDLDALTSKLVNHRCVSNSATNCPRKTVGDLMCQLQGELEDSPRFSSRQNRRERYLYPRRIADLNRYVENFFVPCLNAMNELDEGVVGGRMITTHWTRIDECRDISCGSENSYYDTDVNGCRIRSSDSEIHDIQRLVDQFCAPMIDPLLEPESTVDPCIAAPRSDYCVDDSDLEADYTEVSVYINEDVVAGQSEGDDCFCRNSNLLTTVRVPTASSSCIKIPGVYSEQLGGPWPITSRVSWQVFTSNSAVVSVGAYTGCDCEPDLEFVRQDIDTDCKVGRDFRTCYLITDSQ